MAYYAPHTPPTLSLSAISRVNLTMMVLAGLFHAASALAQDPTPQPEGRPARLPPVRVTVTRDAPRAVLDLPFAVSTAAPDSSRPGQRDVALDEVLAFIPGVLVANRSNPTQDPRISIRGFGSRSSFGVRGVRVLRDGIPLTLPDGQTPVDYLDLESVGSIEVIRGSASALYGNAAGGVIDVRSAEPPTTPLSGLVRGLAGSAGLRRWVASGGGTFQRLRYQANASRTETDGFRRHARQEATSGFARLMTRLAGTDLALQLSGFDMPLAENPGALTSSQAAADPEMADPNFVRRRARKEVEQGQLGLVASRTRGESEIIASVHIGGRSLYNPLTFAIVDLDRASYGAGIRATLPLRLGPATTRWSAGIDLQEQDDDRRNFENCNDTIPLLVPTARCPDVSSERGALLLDQQEIITSAGVFLRGEVAFAGRFRFTLGARADDVKFKVEDRLIISGSNPDDSGERSLSALSPVAGVVVRVGRQTAVYANVSSAFETPTATELANQPDGSAGLNRDLKPQNTTSYELGLKGEAAALSSRLQYDVAIFVARVRDELIPFEVTDIPGRRYFRNAGRTDRRGAEAGLSATAGPVEAGAAYSYSDFEFIDYSVDGVSYAGNRIPGVPRQQLQLYATWRRGGIFTTVEGMSSGRVAANDANSAHVDGYHVMNARAGGSLDWRRSSVRPVIGINNVFGRRYTPSVSVNALAGRYYEPSPGRVVFGGLTLVIGGGDAQNR